MQSLNRTPWLLSAMLSFALLAADDGSLVIGRRPDPPKAAGTDWALLAADLKDVRFERVRDAAMQLAATENPAALQFLWGLFNQGEGQRRALAVQCIGILGVGAQEENLYRIALEDPSISVRHAAAEALMKLKSADAAGGGFT